MVLRSLGGGASTSAINAAIEEAVGGLSALPQAKDFAYLRGVNTQGLGGSQHDATRVPGTIEVDYHANSQEFHDYIRSRGHRLVRVDFLWERLQPTLQGPLSSTGIAELRTVIRRAAKAGLLVLLDMKNYGRRWTAADEQIQFGAGISSEDFADVWGKLATEFADEKAVAMWGLMNEPHDHPDYASSFESSGTVHEFTSDVESWAGASGTTVSWEAANGGTLVGTEANSGSGTQIVTLESPQGSGAGTYNFPVGSTLEIEVSVPASTPGTLWQMRPALITLGFGFEYGPFTAVPQDGQTHKLYFPIPAAVDGTDHRHLILEFTGDGISGSTPLVVKVHSVKVGTYEAPSSTPWKDASQAAVDAIRDTGDTRTIGVAGDDYSWAGGWVSINGEPWITDPADNFVYEAHLYFDPDNSGTYEDVTYSAANAAAVAVGFDNLADRVTTYIGNFITWCETHDVQGFVSEVGWPNHESVAQWNAVGQAFYEACNAAGIGITYWGTGEWLQSDGGAYNQDAYYQLTPQPQTTVIEAPANLSRLTGGGLTGPQALAAVESAPTVSPTGAWDFTTAPTVGGDPLGGDTTPPFTIPAGSWWTPSNSATGTGALGTLNVAVFSPLEIPADMTLDALAVEVSTAATAGGVLRAALYGMSATGGPNMANLIVDFGTVASTTTGIKTFDPASGVALPAGILWFALVPQVATCTVRTSTGGNAHLGLVFPSGTTPPAGSNIQVLNVGGVSGAFPTSGTPGAGTVLVAPPKVYLKAS